MHDHAEDKSLEPLFTGEELLEQRCQLLESELAELGESCRPVVKKYRLSW